MVKNTWRDIPVRNDLTIAQNIHLRLDNQASALDLEVIRILVTIVVRYPNRRCLKPGSARRKPYLERGRPPVGRNRRTGLLNNTEVGAAGPLHPWNARQIKSTGPRVPDRKLPSQRTAYNNTPKVRVINCTRRLIPVHYLLTIAKDFHLRLSDRHTDIVKFTSV